MWAGLRFINGYSPILASGIARELRFAIHGEIDPNYGEYILRDESGALAELGVDGLVVAREIDIDPPAQEWQLAFVNDEARVFHRPGPAFPTVRSVEWIDSIPGKEFALAQLSNISDQRNRVDLDVDVPPGGTAALLRFTRPFFRGYQARLDGRPVQVSSYRGLFPVVELPAAAHGRLTLMFRPRWLVLGSYFAIAAFLTWLADLIFVMTAASRHKHNNG